MDGHTTLSRERRLQKMQSPSYSFEYGHHHCSKDLTLCECLQHIAVGVSSARLRMERKWLLAGESIQGPDEDRVKRQWESYQEWFSAQATASYPCRWVSTPYLQRLDQQDELSWQWVDYHERIVVQVWHTKQGVFRRKLPPDVRDDPIKGQN